MNGLTILGVVLQIVVELLRMRREKAAALGQNKLSGEQKKALNAAVVDALKTKNTATLEAMLKGSPITPPPPEVKQA